MYQLMMVELTYVLWLDSLKGASQAFALIELSQVFDLEHTPSLKCVGMDTTFNNLYLLLLLYNS